MVRIDLVVCRTPYKGFEVGCEYLYRLSKNGTPMVLLNDQWIAVQSDPRLIVGWQFIQFKIYFSYTGKRLFVDNHLRARSVTKDEFISIFKDIEHNKTQEE